jgi:hypothetical protein
VPLALGLAFWTIFAAELKQRWAIIPAIILTSVGIMINLPDPQLFIGVFFGLAALFGFKYYFSRPEHWWAVFPATAFAGVAGVLIVNSIRFLDRTFEAGGMMLIGLSLGFWLLYTRHEDKWWAGIPAGILTTIGFFVLFNQYLDGDFAPIFIFGGFGLTFGMLWVRRRVDGTGWAVWPMSALLGIALIGSVAEYAGNLWPLLFIVVGGWLLARNFVGNRRRPTTGEDVDMTPPQPEPAADEVEIEQHFV